MKKRFYNAIATTHIAGVGLFTTVTDEVGDIYCYGRHTDNRGPYWEKLPPIPSEVVPEPKDSPFCGGRVTMFAVDTPRVSEGPQF